MTRPEFYVVGLKGGEEAWLLCRCCAAVLVCEGRVAGDPTAAGLNASAVEAMAPSSVAHCDTCESLRRFEERRAMLEAHPQRIETGRLRPLLGGRLMAKELGNTKEDA